MSGYLPDDIDDPFFEYVVQEWTAADTDESGSLDKKEISALLNRLNLKVKKGVAKQKFEEVNVNVDSPGELNFTEFLAFLQMLMDRQEMNEVFVGYSEGEDCMTASQFQFFLSQEQKEEKSLEECCDIICKFERFQDDPESPVLYINGFRDFLSHPMNDVYDAKCDQVYHDMTQPLTHYWMASSHNTYCTGDQLKGNSSVDAYITALEMGCRCVELDCWDGPDNEPLIYHGHTLTSRIKFRDVIVAIKEHGFKRSPYPIVLSLENHCSVPQQEAMADIMREVLGDLIPPPFETGDLLPSPAELQYKVLLKGKGLKRTGSAESSEDSEDAAEDEETTSEAKSLNSSGGSRRFTLGFLQKNRDKKVDEKKEKKVEEKKEVSKEKREAQARWQRAAGAARASNTFAAAGQAHKEKEKEVDTQALANSGICAELAEMIHLKTVHIQSFAHSKEHAMPYEMSSFSETKVNKVIQREARAFAEYNHRQMSRVYPKGTRFDSSNYDPQPAWSCGSQMVALNYQTSDKSMWMNEGKFRDNGRAGYLLKPEYMRTLPMEYNPAEVRQTTTIKKILKIEVISGWQLPKVNCAGEEVIDPYVIVQVGALQSDTTKQRTKTIQNNGFNPVWHEEFTFPMVAPEVALLSVMVWDAETFRNDDFIGYNCMPIHCIRPGYRNVPLFNGDHTPAESGSIFCRFRFEEPKKSAPDAPL